MKNCHPVCLRTGQHTGSLGKARSKAARFAGTPWLQERQAENPLVIVSGIVVDGSKCSGKVVIPDGVKAVAEMAFRGNTAITSVYVPDSVKQMGSEIFAGCENLQSVSVPAEIGDQLTGDMVEVRAAD